MRDTERERERERETDRQTDRQTERERERETERDRDTHTHRQRERETETETERHTHTDRQRERESHLQVFVAFPVLDPGLALALWINEQWEACCLGDDQTVLNGQLIVGQTLQVPLCNHRVVHQHLDDVQVLHTTHDMSLVMWNMHRF